MFCSKYCATTNVIGVFQQYPGDKFHHCNIAFNNNFNYNSHSRTAAIPVPQIPTILNYCGVQKTLGSVFCAELKPCISSLSSERHGCKPELHFSGYKPTLPLGWRRIYPGCLKKKKRQHRDPAEPPRKTDLGRKF